MELYLVNLHKLEEKESNPSGGGIIIPLRSAGDDEDGAVEVAAVVLDAVPAVLAFE